MLIKVREAPQSLRERAKLEVRIEELAGLPEYHPFEFHIVDERGFRRYVEVLKVKRLRSSNFYKPASYFTTIK